MQKRKVLVTGGSGFIGANLVRKLVKKNFDVHLILRKNSNTYRLQDILTSVTIHVVPLANKKELNLKLQKINPNYIFHLAAFGNYSWHSNIPLMIKTNIVELENLLEASKEIKYSCFINTGSSTEYGFINRPIKETDALSPESFYGVTKASGTLLCQTFARRYRKPIITFRLFSVYGPYEEDARFIPTVIKSAIVGREIFVTMEKIKRDFVHVDDVVNAYLKAIKQPYVGEIFNIGTGRQYSNNQIIEYIGDIHGPLNISHVAFPARHWDSSNCVSDISKTQIKLNWVATYGIKEGLNHTYNWYRKNL